MNTVAAATATATATNAKSGATTGISAGHSSTKITPPPLAVSTAAATTTTSTTKISQNNNNNNSSNNNYNNKMTSEERQREQALHEVEQVMKALGTTSTQLDHFNLLGVVANPRGSQHGVPPPPPTSSSTSMLHLSSAHGPNNNNNNNNNSATNTVTSADASDYFIDTYQSLESVATSVSGQIEALNSVFEDWSRQYLNDYYYYSYSDGSGGGGSGGADAIPESQLTELPPELDMSRLDLNTVQIYLRQSGPLATNFRKHDAEKMAKQARQVAWQKQQEQEQQEEEEKEKVSKIENSNSNQATKEDVKNRDTTTTTTTTAAANSPDNLGIPAIFFQPDFDLTNPQTFRELLLTNGGGGGGDDDNNDSSNDKKHNNNSNIDNSLYVALNEPTHDLFHIPSPDYFTADLDKVEVALLEQVREKSEAFFQETNRFAQLKEWVSELLVAVQHIRSLLGEEARAIQSWQQVPEWDRKRHQLQYLERILEGANDILRCKQCIGGLLSAKDDLGAVEQIQYARRLLAGTAEANKEDDLKNINNNNINNQGYHRNNSNGDDDTSSATAGRPPKLSQHVSSSFLPDKEAPIELGRMEALRTVGEQLNQYESLVVTSLTEEVVEIFLEWDTSALASLYSSTNASSSNTSSNGTPSSMRAASHQELQRRTLSICTSLQMCGALSHMSKFYSTRLHDMVRMTVRTTVGEFASDASSNSAATSVSVNVTAMSLERFLDCLDMLFEQLLGMLTSAAGVDEFCQKEGLDLRDAGTKVNGNANARNGSFKNTAAAEDGSDLADKKESAISEIVASAAELSSKSIAELLRLRKEVHALVSLDEMRQIWETCIKFVDEVENLSGHKCVALRTMLFSQAKAFVERKHDSNMTALAAALDSERWTQCEVSNDRQVALTRLCTGRAGMSSRGRLMRSSSIGEGHSNTAKSPEAEVEGIRYKVVWSCLLLVEMIMTNIEAAACFQNLASMVVGKVSELLRLFNSRATQLVLGAGAIHSAARLKSINAKHLSLVTQCLGMTIAILPHIRASLSQQLPPKQHTLLNDLDKIKKEYADHNEKVLNKFVTIIGGIVEHGLAKHIAGTDFDARAKQGSKAPGDSVACCVFLEGVLTNTRKMHQVLSALLPPEHLQDVFSRIFAFIDQKIPSLMIAATEKSGSNGQPAGFSFPGTNDGKQRLLDEVASMTKHLNALDGVFPWEFSAVSVLAKTLEYEIPIACTNASVPLPTKEPAVDSSPEDESKEQVNDEKERDATEESNNDATVVPSTETSTEQAESTSADGALETSDEGPTATTPEDPKESTVVAESADDSPPEKKSSQLEDTIEDKEPVQEPDVSSYETQTDSTH